MPLYHDWDNIEAHYVSLNQSGWKHERFIDLIKYIKVSGLSERLFAITSLDKLVISIYEVIDFHKEALHISFDRENLQWHFDYYAVPYKPPEFAKIYAEDKAIEKLDNFIRIIGW